MNTSKLSALTLSLGVGWAGTPALADTATEAAKALVAPFYDAFNPAPGKDVGALLRSVTAEDWVSCGGNDTCAPRDAVIAGITGFGQAIPNLTWAIKETILAGDKIIVRGEANGTPPGEFIGAPHSGKSFTIMSIDIHTVRDGKIVQTYGNPPVFNGFYG